VGLIFELPASAYVLNARRELTGFETDGHLIHASHRDNLKLSPECSVTDIAEKGFAEF
jgi:hypothetical protein